MNKLREFDVMYVPGVGPARAKLLAEELGVKSAMDLLEYYPYRYVDRSKVYRINEIDGNMPFIQLTGRILSVEVFGEGRKRRMVAHFSDGTGVVDLVWFSGIKYFQGLYKVNHPYVVFGRPAVFNGRVNISHPEMDDLEKVDTSDFGLRPMYHTSEKMKRRRMTSNVVAELVMKVLEMATEPFRETLSREIVEANRLMSLNDALRQIHRPSSPKLLRDAQYRLKFEELFFVQLNIMRYRKSRHEYQGLVFDKVGEKFNRFFFERLPFELTGAQKRVVKEIRMDTRTGSQMNRLVQGDVGSGKTLVALLAMLIGIDSGFQCCLMAPTEILAGQHFQTVSEYMQDMGVRVELLTGSVKIKKRREILKGLSDGDVDILIGTHAVLEDPVVFSNLGLAVIDEQHRFGVKQRARLWLKNTIPPHVLVMTATPIPRTLAMTLYGDLDVSVIDELPPGRKPVKTMHTFDENRGKLFEFMRSQLREGRQIYIVYPLIEESEKLDLKNLEQGFELAREVFPQYKISKVHGKMAPAAKEEEMQRFVSGETRIMVATTVIEVGVNVPNATVMVIQNAERFGLSQLHQLRGRVGRGADQSYCVLVTNRQLSKETTARIETMTSTNDGFEIAEADLKLRGPGDLEGLRQSGDAFDLKIADLSGDGQLLAFVRDIAESVIAADPGHCLPENAPIWERLSLMKEPSFDWGAIS